METAPQAAPRSTPTVSQSPLQRDQQVPLEAPDLVVGEFRPVARQRLRYARVAAGNEAQSLRERQRVNRNNPRLANSPLLRGAEFGLPPLLGRSRRVSSALSVVGRVDLA